MDRETAQMLLQTIADIQQLTFDAQYKMLALERTLKDLEPNVYGRYQTELAAVRKAPPFESNPVGYSNLHEKLVRS